MSLGISALGLLLGSLATLPVLCAQSLRVCADPGNLPYSDVQKQGFENRIAALIAKDLNEELHYFWFPQRENFFRKTINQGLCDVVMGVPVGMKGLETTRSYYRSSYVFVTRKDQNLRISSFDDPQLRSLKIGVHVLSEQGDSLPPVYALTSRGITKNLVGISIFGNLNEKDPSTDLLKAVADKQVDVAVVWGPLAGYFAQHSPVPLCLTPVVEGPREQSLPFHFEIAIGVRKGETALRDALDAELERRRGEIAEILQSYGVPQPNIPSSSSDIRKSEVCGY
jgi:quinoprotein dehydrogenase-associated probable ABC transporter substrate-binding protein